MAAREPAPGGGAVAALTVASAAGLVAMAARFDDGDGREALVEEADTIRLDALRLAEEDTVAYADVLQALRTDRTEEVAWRRAIRAALSTAIDVPLAVVERGHRIAALGVPMAVGGNPNLRGDAATGVHLAVAAARSAAHLVRLNAALGGLGSGRVDQADAWCADLHETVQALDEAPA